MSASRRPRLFLDSNVLTAGILLRWGVDKAVLSLCAAGICRLVLADVVKEEVEESLLLRLARRPEAEASAGLEDYAQLMKLMRPERVPYPARQQVLSARHLIRHEADVPVLLSAIASRPDWLLTNNVKHFTAAVALRTGLRIARPVDFFRVLSRSLTPG